MIVDDVVITVQAGHGGRGVVAFSQTTPDGGDGGRGGNVQLRVTQDLKALSTFASSPKVIAPDGSPGAKRNLSGKSGQDITITLPIGTTLTNIDTQETIELTEIGQTFLLCKGGLGGRGNAYFKSPTNRSPHRSQPGLPGETKSFHLVLKFIADYGLVGLPNAGKSSILNELTNAKAQVGAYPFTTLEANLGAFGTKVIADIPGLIEGASKGKGLGIKFLKHIEKVQLLLHCIAADSENVLSDYQTINQELTNYNPALITKRRFILLTKTDLVDKATLDNQIKVLKKLKHSIYPVSIHDMDSITSLATVL